MRRGKREIPFDSSFIFGHFGDFSHKRNIWAMCVTADDTEDNANRFFNRSD